MKYIDIKDKNLSELQQLLKDKKSELFTLKIKLKNMQLNKSSEISLIRKDIARILTVIAAKNKQDDFQKNERK